MNPPIVRLRWVVLLGIAGIALLSCARALERRSPPAAAPSSGIAVATTVSGPRMPHSAHLEKGLECADCHLKDAKGNVGTEPHAPTYAQCQDCHDEEDAKKPEPQKIKNLFFQADGSPKWTRALGHYGGDVTFRHAPHAKKTGCTVCHGEMKDLKRQTGLMFTMQTCVACHAQKGGSQACQTCHAVIREDVPPESHRQLWRERHGQITRSASEVEEGRCTLCHKGPTSCERCHREEKPHNHNNLWRIQTHGLMASIDRTTCQVCHSTDYCERCHEETAPRSHRGHWVSNPSQHCAQCHFPVSSNPQCVVCHKTPPMHSSAPDQPASHVPGMNCRLCHTPPGMGGAPPTPHIDNGMACQFCHH